MALLDLRPPQFRDDEPKKQEEFDWLGLIALFFLGWIIYGVVTGGGGSGISDCEAENIRAIHEQAGRLKDSGQGQAGDNLKSSARRIAKSRC